MVISATNLKGGVGKTTTVITLGCCLSAIGNRVLMVDLDASHTLTAKILPAPVKLEQSTVNIFSTPSSLPTNLTMETRYNRIDIIPGHSGLYRVDHALMTERGVTLSKFKKCIAALKANYDYILIDTPPSYGGLIFNTLAASELCLVPFQAESLGFHSVHTLLDCFRTAEKGLNRPLNYKYLLTMYDSNMKSGEQVLDILKDKFGDSILNTRIGYDVNFNDSNNYGQTICEYAPDSPGCLAYQELAREIEQLRAGNSKEVKSSHGS